ncbi:LINE-1 retrotransposable element ORF1 protein [Dissostichus eleginoides]|uniref:LINE-1 retrotransposable element ORF1 protein n=1 Tax=Dissostichus eleginoides TaxID=100907 RepID=A0AAD9BBS5_DISEL|nr:LINE-1 retrotransposable element ORF1 protein [Dissostichus eleginoides]
MPRGKGKKLTQTELFDGDGASLASSASSVVGDDDTPTHLEEDQTGRADMTLILKELREFRKDNGQQLKEICEEINKTNTRIAEAEGRIEATETRLQVAVTELLQLQVHLDAKLTDLEGRSKRENIQIHGVKEGAEDNSPLMGTFVETLLREGLDLPATFELRVERTHRALMPKPPGEASPRSIVVKLSSYRTKEELLRIAWQKRGFRHLKRRVNLDHDYAPDVLRKRRAYAEAETVLRERKIRFQTPFPARLRVFYGEGIVAYGSAEEVTDDMAKRGLPVSVIKHPDSLLERIQRITWRTSKRPGTRDRAGRNVNYKEKLEAFRHKDSA